MTVTAFPMLVDHTYWALDRVLDQLEGLEPAALDANPPAVGMKLDLSFRLPPRITPIECTGGVMWAEKDGPGADGSGVGIEFDEMEADDAEAVTDFVLGKLRNSTGPIR